MKTTKPTRSRAPNQQNRKTPEEPKQEETSKTPQKIAPHKKISSNLKIIHSRQSNELTQIHFQINIFFELPNTRQGRRCYHKLTDTSDVQSVKNKIIATC